MYRYLLDTNIVSGLIKHPQGVITHKIIQVGEETICTSLIVAAELRFGAQKSSSQRLKTQVNALLESLVILPFESPADLYYAILRNDLEKRGCPIGPNDMLIAAQALAQNLTLVTANQGEFARIPNLRVENWLY